MTTYAPDSDPFVGRESELAELTAALDDAQSGRGRMTMLAGEPGIGKTRTAEAIAEIGAERGFITLWARCPEERGAPSYWPWVQIIRSCIASLDGNTVRAAFGPNAGIIAEIVPDVATLVPDMEPPPELSDPDSARFRLYDAFATFLRAIAQDSPLILVLDDLHWADGSSLRLLEFVAQEQIESQILIVGTYRDTEVTSDHPLFTTLGDLSRRRLFSRLMLRGLDITGVGDLLEGLSGVAPQPDVTTAIHTQTQGNPLFVGEMARYLGQEGLLTDHEQLDIALPEGIREVISRRLNRHSAYANDILTLAAITGARFSFTQLSATAHEDSPEDLIAVLDEALASRVLEPVPGESAAYQFTHALIQQTLIDDLSLADRVQLHARVAEALERLYGDQAEDHAAELAVHYAEAQMVLGTDRLVHYALLAGEAALSELAFEVAATHFETALEAQSDEPMGETKARTLYGYGVSQGYAAEMGKGIDALDQAFDFYMDSGDHVRAIQIMIDSPTNDTQNPETIRRIREALEIVEKESAAEAWVVHLYAMALDASGGEANQQAANEAHERGLELAHLNADSSMQVKAMAAHASTLFARGDLRAGLDLAEGALALVDSNTAIEGERNAAMWAGCFATQLGLPDRARIHGARNMAAARRTGSQYRELNGYVMGRSCLWDALGDFETLIEDHDAARILVPGNVIRIGGYIKLAFAAAWAMFERGNADEGQEQFDYCETFVRGGEDRLQTLAALPRIAHIARLTGDASHLGVAKEWLGWVESASFGTGYENGGQFARAIIAAMEDNPNAAALAYERLQSCPTQIAHYGPSSDRIIGLAAHTMGDPHIAARHFDEALKFCRNATYKPELAWTCHDYAEMLLVSSDALDRQKFGALLDEGLRVTGELGMVPLGQRLSTLRGQSDQLAPAHPAGLTDRQVEILTLLAAGRSNREIAEELFITTNTVHSHVANIFTKIDVSNRVEAAAFASEYDIKSDA